MRTVRTERYRRGPFGHLVKWAFILFNLGMLAWLVLFWGALPEPGAMSEAEQAGVAVGGLIGTGVVLFFWAGGAVILGLAALLTRGRKVIVEEWAGDGGGGRREPGF